MVYCTIVVDHVFTELVMSTLVGHGAGGRGGMLVPTYLLRLDAVQLCIEGGSRTKK